MGQISLQIPVVGQPDTTEDVKIQNDLTAIQNVINGNLDTNNLSSTAGVKDTQLASPNSAARRLLLTQFYVLGSGLTYTSGAYGWSYSGGPLFLSGAPAGSAAPQVWFPDASLAVAGKTTFGVIRMNTIANAVTPNVTLNAGLTGISSASGASAGLTVGFSAPTLATAQLTIAASTAQTADSAPFTLPTGAGAWMPVLAATGTSPTATNSFVGVYVSLYAYNA